MEETRLDVTRPLAPEDLEAGQFVAVLQRFKEFIWPCAAFDVSGAVRTIRYRELPEETDTPLKIVEVCLPFVLVRKPDGSHLSIDTRQVQLTRVSDRFGRKCFKRLRRKEKSAAASTLDD